MEEVSSAVVVIRRRAYAQLCKDKGWTRFEPQTGICWSCKQQIFKIHDGTERITGCPHCHKSFVE